MMAAHPLPTGIFIEVADATWLILIEVDWYRDHLEIDGRCLQ